MITQDDQLPSGYRLYQFDAGYRTGAYPSGTLAMPEVLVAELIQAREDAAKEHKRRTQANRRRRDLRARKREERASSERDAQSKTPIAPKPAPLLGEPLYGPKDSVRVFSPEAVRAAQEAWGGKDKERYEPWLDEARRLGGWRAVPALRSEALNSAMERLEQRFPNFRNVVDYLRIELALNFALPGTEFRMPPLLMSGAPGIGKTAFSEMLAEVLNSTPVRIPASAQGAFEITGTARHWNNAAPGRVFNALAGGTSASPILILDEMDKMGSSDPRYDILPALLSLLEPESARVFEDQAVAIQMDASKAITVATANDLHRVPAPLMSRLHVVEIVPPTRQEMRQIAQTMADRLTSRLDRPVSVPVATLDGIARDAADLRELQRLVRQVVGRAVLDDGGARPFPVAAAGRAVTRKMGFL
ncbi:MAG: AAA family ATPase [Rhodocyclaceae bacterium]|nr:AAA family ATPase [Rhodocyclaceae bacterium]